MARHSSVLHKYQTLKIRPRASQLNQLHSANTQSGFNLCITWSHPASYQQVGETYYSRNYSCSWDASHYTYKLYTLSANMHIPWKALPPLLYTYWCNKYALYYKYIGYHIHIMSEFWLK